MVDQPGFWKPGAWAANTFWWADTTPAGYRLSTTVPSDGIEEEVASKYAARVGAASTEAVAQVHIFSPRMQALPTVDLHV